MSDLQKRAAAEVVNVVSSPSDIVAEELKIRRMVAVDILSALYLEVMIFAGEDPNKIALEAIRSGKTQYYLLGPDRIQQRFDRIEGFIAQGEGASRDENLAALFNNKKIYGELAVDLYVVTLGMFERAYAKECEVRLKDASHGRKLDKLLKTQRPTKKQRRWLEHARKNICGLD